MDDDNYISHDEAIPATNILKYNNTIGAHIVESHSGRKGRTILRLG